MRVERSFDPSKEFYAKRSFKYSGRDYVRGDKFPSRDISNKQLLKFYQNGFVGYSEDFRDNKAAIKEVSIEKEEPQVKSEEVVEQKDTEEKPKRRYRSKKKTQPDSQG